VNFEVKTKTNSDKSRINALNWSTFAEFIAKIKVTYFFLRHGFVPGKTRTAVIIYNYYYR